MAEWEECQLGDALTLQRGFDLPKRLRKPGPHPIVSSAGVTGSHGEYKVDPPGIVIGRYGSLGSVHWVEDPFWPLNTALWVRDFKGNDARFLSYLLQTVTMDGSSASAVPGVNRNHLHKISVRVPRLSTQKRIAAVLSSFDELIEINERRIELLEDLARSLYREWFVHFRFPGYEKVKFVDSALGRIPTNWKIKSLFEVADVGFGFAYKSQRFESGSYPVVRIRDIPRGTASTCTDEEADPRFRIVDQDVLIGMDGIFHIRQWSDGDAWLNQRVARIRSLGELNERHLMLAISGQIEQLNKSIVGTTVAHLGKRHLEEIQVLVPSQSLLSEAGASFDSLARTLAAYWKWNRRLAATRDLLLPRLVTGKLDISDIDLGTLTPEETE